MKTRKNQKTGTISKLEAFLQPIFELFTRKTDSEKRSELYGKDPLRNLTK